MRPRGYDPSRSSRFYDPTTGRYVDSFDDFLRLADEIAKARDSAEKYYDRAVDRIREGVPQTRAKYWRQRLQTTRATLAEQNAFFREIDEQLSRPERKKKPTKKEREKEPEPRAVQGELNLDYNAKLAAHKASEVEISIRFWRRDRQPMTMAEMWAEVNVYRATGSFAPHIEVEAIDWLGIAAKRKGRGKTMETRAEEIQNALGDFFGIIHAVEPQDLNLVPLRLGSVKEDG